MRRMDIYWKSFFIHEPCYCQKLSSTNFHQNFKRSFPLNSDVTSAPLFGTKSHPTFRMSGSIENLKSFGESLLCADWKLQ